MYPSGTLGSSGLNQTPPLVNLFAARRGDVGCLPTGVVEPMRRPLGEVIYVFYLPTPAEIVALWKSTVSGMGWLLALRVPTGCGVVSGARTGSSRARVPAG